MKLRGAIVVALAFGVVSGCATTERAELHLDSRLENHGSQPEVIAAIVGEPNHGAAGELRNGCIHCRREGAGSVLVWRWMTTGHYAELDDERGFTLSIGFQSNDIAGEWDLAEDSIDRPVIVYTQGPTPSEQHARCLGYAKAGTLRVLSIGYHRWIADADLEIRFIERPESSSHCTAGRLRRSVEVSVAD